MRATFPALVLAVVFSTITVPARAGPHEDSVARFDEGRALVKAGRPADAIPKFLASLTAEPSAVAALNLADCYERVGKLASAQERFRQAESLSAAKGDMLRASEARKRAESLEGRVSRITVLPAPQGVTASAWIDGAPLPADAWGKPRPFDPGPHEVVLQTSDGKRQTRIVSLSEEGTKVTVPFDIEGAASVVTEKKEKAEPDPRPPPHTQEPSESPSSSSPLRTVAIVTGAVGVASLVAGGVTGGLALGAKSDLDAACSTYPRCPSSQKAELEDIDSRGRTMATVSTITFIAGAALLTTGMVLWFVSSPGVSTEKKSALRALSGRFEF
jgi:hypothetical protein